MLSILGLTYIRQKSNMSMKELADKLQVTNTIVSKWEKKVRAIPTVRLNQLFEIFNVPVDYYEKNLSQIDMVRIDNILSTNLETYTVNLNEYELKNHELTHAFNTLFNKLEMIKYDESDVYITQLEMSFCVFINENSFIKGDFITVVYNGVDNESGLSFSIDEYDGNRISFYLNPCDINHIYYRLDGKKDEYILGLNDTTITIVLYSDDIV